MIEWDRIRDNVYGNPRYVCHYLHLALKGETYEQAVKRANTIGGRKHHCKSYGGGIVFVSYNLEETETKIRRVMQEARLKCLLPV